MAAQYGPHGNVCLSPPQCGLSYRSKRSQDIQKLVAWQRFEVDENGGSRQGAQREPLAQRCPMRERSRKSRKRTIRMYIVRTRADDYPDGSRKSSFSST
jgi:hypothetical protein